MAENSRPDTMRRGSLDAGAECKATSARNAGIAADRKADDVPRSVAPPACAASREEITLIALIPTAATPRINVYRRPLVSRVQPGRRRATPHALRARPYPHVRRV